MCEWKSIETSPTSENESFLVLTRQKDVFPCVVVQVSVFEGRRYPDGRQAIIDWDDAITEATATRWMPVPKLPEA